LRIRLGFHRNREQDERKQESRLHFFSQNFQ
jgi:hypothetical protein